MTQYLYLPRLKNDGVLLEAIAEGVASTVWNQHFAYAEGWNPDSNSYSSLRAGETITPTLSDQSLLVKPEIAQQQLEVEKAAAEARSAVSPASPNSRSTTGSPRAGELAGTWNSHGNSTATAVAPTQVLRRFHGNVDLDAVRLNRDINQIATEVIQHLTTLQGAQVKITLEIEAEIPDGVTDDVQRTVLENCRTLRFKAQAFEEQ